MYTATFSHSLGARALDQSHCTVTSPLVWGWESLLSVNGSINAKLIVSANIYLSV